MEQGGHYYYAMIARDPATGEGRLVSVHYIEGRNGERALPVFTTAAKAYAHVVRTHLDEPEAHLPMLKRVDRETFKGRLTEGRDVIIGPRDTDELAMLAARVGAHYLVRNPGSGHDQDIMRLR